MLLSPIWIITISAVLVLHLGMFCSGSSFVSSKQNSFESSQFFMGKGDGKKRRKKASTDVSTTNDDEKLPEPLRVTSNSIISVRRQIEWARMKKDIASSGNSFRNGKARTSYRKQGPVGPDELLEARKARKEKATDEWAVWTNSTSSPLVLIDGYNVIYQWPRLKKHMVNGNIKRAREMLISDLEELKIVKGWRIEVIFDGKFRSTKGVLGDDVGGERITEQDMENTSKDVAKGVRVTYSGIGTTADTYIEGRCFQAKNVTEGKLTGSLIVVTDDNLIRIAAVSAGAVLVGSERIVDELKVVRKAIMYKIESAIARETGVPMRHESLHGKHEEITFKMGKFKVVDKRNTTNTRQERWRKKTAEKRAARERMLNSISDEGKLDERKIIEVGAKLPSLQKKKQTKPEKSSEIEYIKKHTHVPSLQKQEQIKAKRSNNVVSIGTQKNMRSSANENGLLAGVVQKFEEFDVTSPKAILNEYYQVQHRVSINLKNQYITQSKSDGSSTIWNADFQCPITNQRFAAGLYGKGYTIDKKTHEVWFQTKAIAEHAAAHAALRQLLYS